MKKVICLLISSILCGLLFACGKDTSADDVVKKIPAETDPRYSLKSQYTDWNGEFAVTYMDVNVMRQTVYHGSEECWMEIYPIVEIVNTGNTPLAMYDFRLENYILKDGEGHEEEDFFVDVYPAILSPGETGYLSGYMLSDIWKKDAELELALDISEDLMTNLYEEKDFGLTEVKVSELTVVNDENDGHITISGSVKNTSNAEAWVDIYAVLFDENNIPVCVLNTFVDKVPVGETVDFIAKQRTFDKILAEDIASYQVVAYAH